MNRNRASYYNIPKDAKVKIIAQIANEFNFKTFLDIGAFNDESSKVHYMTDFKNGFMRFAVPALDIEVDDEGWVGYRLLLDSPSWEEEGFDMARLYLKLVSNNYTSIAIDRECEIYRSDVINEAIPADIFEDYMRSLLQELSGDFYDTVTYIRTYREALDDD